MITNHGARLAILCLDVAIRINPMRMEANMLGMRE